MKIAASTRLEKSLYLRAEVLAEKDNRKVSNVIELCVIRHLPELEREILGGTFVEPVAGKNKKPGL